MKYLLHNFINTLRHYKASSLLNIVGMAASFAAFYLILTQVSWDLGYNRKIKDVDRIFAVTIPSSYSPGKLSPYLNRPVGEMIASSSPLIEEGGMASFFFNNGNMVGYIRQGENVRRISFPIRAFSLDAIRLFGFEAESGSIEDLETDTSAAISSSMAERYGIGIGDRITQTPEGEGYVLDIAVIYKDFQNNSNLGDLGLIYNFGETQIDDWSEWSYPYFVKLKDAADKEAFEEEAFKRILSMMSGQDEEELRKSLKVTLIPYSDLFYSKNLDGAEAITKLGNKTTDITLLAVAILIILIALINFINFFFALVPARIRSVNTYKIFGVTRRKLIIDFILESLGIVLIALLLGAVLVTLVGKTALGGVLTAPTGFEANATLVLITVAIAIVAAVVGSIFPAFYITSFQPALVLKGSFGSTPAGKGLRDALIGVQFVISISLIICSGFIKLQHSYMMNYDMGFDKEQLLSGSLPSSLGWYGESNSALEDKLRANPMIKDITWSGGSIIAQQRMGWGRMYKDKEIHYQCYPVSYNFLDFMGMEMVDGRNFTKSDELAVGGTYIFNEDARDEFEITLDSTMGGHADEDATIAGFCKNFNFRPLQYSGGPFAFYVYGTAPWRELTNFYVRMNAGADPADVMEFIRKTALEIRPDTEPDAIEVDFFDKELGKQYLKEKQFSKLIGFFTILAIIISLMGVFGLVLFETQHKSREIALRRVMGANVKDILLMLNRKFIIIVGICFAVAAPVSLAVMRSYLSTFAYHTNLSWWVFALALLSVLVITAAIVTLRSLDAATKNPVESIKSE